MQHYSIICGGLKIPNRLSKGEKIFLDVQGNKNVELKIDAIHKSTASNIPDELLDLLEIGAYVYCADQQIRRGSDILTDYGTNWRRSLSFTIPVRNPDLWNGLELREALEETLGFLADETYHFSFERANAPLATKQRYFELSKEGVEPDEVALFSGGLDSFAGTVEGIAGNHRKMALVGHYSANQVKSVQTGLIEALNQRGHKAQIQYISVEVRNSGIAILAAGIEAHDPAHFYKVDLLTGDRSLDKEIVMAASYVKFAQQFSSLSKDQFISEHPQIAPALNEFDDLTTAEAEEKIFQLYQRHSQDVLGVLNKGLDSYRGRLLQGTLPSSCLIATSFNRNIIQAVTPSGYDNQMREAINKLSTIRCQFYVDTTAKQIVFKGGYTMAGVNYALVEALLDNFRNGRNQTDGPAYIKGNKLAKTLNIEEPVLRQRITRFRNEVTIKLSIDQGIVLETNDFIENAPSKGYRLHPRLKEVPALSDLAD